MKRIIISENERSRILDMHRKHYKNNLVTEQEFGGYTGKKPGQGTTDPGPADKPAPVKQKTLPCAKTAEEILSGKALLYMGCKNDLVKQFQERVASAGRSGSLAGNKMIGEKGAWGNPTDGNFGSRTRNAAIDFQKEMGLKPDGVVGKSTWEKISEYQPEITFDVNSKSWVFKDTFEPVDSSWYSGKERNHGQMQPIAGKLNTQQPEQDIKLNNTNQGVANPNANQASYGPGYEGYNADSDGDGTPDYLETNNPQNATNTTTQGGGGMSSFVNPQMAEIIKQQQELMKQQNQQNQQNQNKPGFLKRMFNRNKKTQAQPQQSDQAPGRI